MSMREYKVSKFKLITYLLDQGIPVDEILNATINNLTPEGFVFPSRNIPTTPELTKMITEYFRTNRNLIQKYLFGGAKGKQQSLEGFVTSIKPYLISIGKSLSDYGLKTTKKRKDEPQFNTIEDVLQFLKEKQISLPEDTSVVPENVVGITSGKGKSKMA